MVQETPLLPPLEMPASPVSPAAAMSPVSPEPVVKVVITKSEPVENPAEAAKLARVRGCLESITIFVCYIGGQAIAVVFVGGLAGNSCRGGLTADHQSGQ